MDRSDPLKKNEARTDSSAMLIPQYRVLIHNDDITPMDFVITVLIRFFLTDETIAREVMLEAHKTGSALVAVMPFERAEFKIEKAHEYSRSFSYPLTFSLEPA